MRRLLLPILLIALATPAGAQQGSKMIIPPTPTAKEAGLRGDADAAKAKTATEAAPAPMRTPLPQPLDSPSPLTPPLASTALGSGGALAAPQCRTSCAQAYYFCQNSGDEQCGVRWGRCVIGCS